MTEDARETWLSWLRDAHAMEVHAETMLNAQIERLETYPAIKMRLEQHLRETEAQREAVGRLLESHGETASVLKDGMAKFLATGQGLSGVFADDEVMKGSLAAYAFEHMEIASYRMLIAGAQELGLQYAIPVLDPILEQEIAMADWLAENLAPLTRSFLARSASDLQAKR